MAKRKSETPKPPTMKVESLMRELKVQLSPPEVAERADRAAKLLEDRDHEEAELKAHASHVKSKIAAMESEMRHLRTERGTRGPGNTPRPSHRSWRSCVPKRG